MNGMISAPLKWCKEKFKELNQKIDECPVYSDEVEVTSAVLRDADTLDGHPSSYYATNESLGQKFNKNSIYGNFTELTFANGVATYNAGYAYPLVISCVALGNDSLLSCFVSNGDTGMVTICNKTNISFNGSMTVSIVFLVNNYKQ